MKKKTKRKKSLLRIVLTPILCMVVIQGTVPFLTLVFSGIKSNLEKRTIQMDSHMIENCQVILENDMVEKWRSVYMESDELTEKLQEILKKEQISMKDFLASTQSQKNYLNKVFPQMIDNLQYNTASGIYLILANRNSTKEENTYQGFFVRDSDPQSKTASNTDLLLERGNKQLAHDMSISLDSAWATEFHFQGEGQRKSDDFFYKPYLAALQNKDSAMVDLGYWSRPFVLEDHYMDNHQMITYSVPLKYEDEIYGILGVEISVNYLNNYFTIKDLDSSMNAGYALVSDQGNDCYEKVLGKGALYDTVDRDKKGFYLKKQANSELRKVEGAKVGNKNICAIVKPLNLYKNNVPYSDTKWSVCGFVTADSVYGLGESVYTKMIAAIIGSAILVAVVVYILMRYVTKPVYRLMESVRGGVSGIHNFKQSNILEIDELHDVIETLTDAQKAAEEQLLEEKERYQIAVESSDDIFFTFRKKECLLEIVNSTTFNGVWDCKKHPEYLENNCIYQEDKEKVIQAFKTTRNRLSIEFRLRRSEKDPYEWVNLSGSFILDKDGTYNRIVGCIHNIQQHKLLEEAQRNKQIFDSTTSFYRLAQGLDAIQTARRKQMDGSLVITDIDGFSHINEQYGLVFGDLILERLAICMRQELKEQEIQAPIYIRAGADQMILWMPKTDENTAQTVMAKIREKFVALTDENYLLLNFRSAITHLHKRLTLQQGIKRCKVAMAVAKQKSHICVLYEQLEDTEKKILVEKKFDEIDSVEQLKKMSLSSIAMNLFDRGGETPVVLDILAIKLKEKYGLDNLVITHFNREFLVNSASYIWKKNDHYQSWDGIIHCSGSEYQQYIENKKMQKILPITERELQDPTIREFLDRRNGLIFHIEDGRQYAGSIFFMGIHPRILQDEENKKGLEEIGAIIQNKINLQRHDLSAQAKSDFLARMSHEIRTPMNGIIGMTEIALKDGQTEEKRKHCLEKIKSSSGYLLSLLNDILDMSKIESGKMRLVIEPCYLKNTLNNIATIMEPKIEEKKLHYIQEIKLEHECFYCDELRINQIVVNLLSNAVKYSNLGGNVRFRVTERKGTQGKSKLAFFIQDDGIGIAKEKQKLIFQSFEQADDSEKARRQGTGLGLAICSRLVHMMDSEITLDSELDKGSIFRFEIELMPIAKKEMISDENKPKIDFKGKRVLVVEDNALNLEIIHTLLEEYGFLVEEARNGLEAVDFVMKHEEGYLDLILMDIMMPVMDGLEATKEIRKIQREDCSKIPIIAMSANAFDEDVKRSLASGMNAHLSKPVNIRKLEETLAQIMK